MQTQADLIRNIIQKQDQDQKNATQIIASLASEPGKEAGLKAAVKSLLQQVDILLVFLNGFDNIPGFLQHEKTYITRSQDFGNLGECGKYYWMGDLAGYHFICSDRFIYPANYVKTLLQKLDDYHKKAIVGCGGYFIQEPFVTFNTSTEHLPEIQQRDINARVNLLKDSSLAYHSEYVKVSRHHFYQPELSSLWFSLLAKEQQVPMICLSNEGLSLTESGDDPEPLSDDIDKNNYRSWFVKTYFTNAGVCPSNNDINVWFDRIYVMSLDRRTDRWEKVLRRTQKCDIRITRFPAVDGYKEPVKSQFEEYFQSGLLKPPDGIEPIQTFREKYFQYRHYVSRIEFMERKLGRKAIQSPGALGYALSYITILKKAITSDFNRIIIFDDDIILHKNFNEEFKKRMEMLPDDWLLIMLGAMQHHWEPTWITWYNEFLYHCFGSSIASHAVGLDRRAFLPVLYYSQKLDLPIDEGAVYHIQQVYAKQCYVFYPNLVIQDVGESDINSSVLTAEQIQKKNNLFRWDYNYYDIPNHD